MILQQVMPSNLCNLLSLSLKTHLEGDSAQKEGKLRCQDCLTRLHRQQSSWHESFYSMRRALRWSCMTGHGAGIAEPSKDCPGRRTTSAARPLCFCLSSVVLGKAICKAELLSWHTAHAHVVHAAAVPLQLLLVDMLRPILSMSWPHS